MDSTIVQNIIKNLVTILGGFAHYFQDLVTTFRDFVTTSTEFVTIWEASHYFPPESNFPESLAIP